MDDNEKPGGHHVAWADRIGLNKQWGKAIDDCRMGYGTPFYPSKVNGFRILIINIRNGPQLKTMIDNYVDNNIREWKDKTFKRWCVDDPINAQSDGWVRDTKKIIEVKSMEHIFNFMLQLLEDHGFCFYESNIEEDEME